jgi:hypothetical protein
MDTDSLYVNFEPWVEKNGFSDAEAEEELDKFCEEKIQIFLDKMFDNMAKYTNAYKQMMYMKREAIADAGVFFAKKNYALRVLNNEGVHYSEPHIKLLGIEAVKSSTPLPCRIAIKEALEIVLDGNQDGVVEYIANFKESYKNLKFEEIAAPI